MKKILYILLFIFSIALSFTSCTEENIAPKTNDTTESGGGFDSKGR